jgi:hypothetical protein
MVDRFWGDLRRELIQYIQHAREKTEANEYLKMMQNAGGM